MNYVWLRPLALHFKDKVPGATILTDIWLYLNEKCDKKLLSKPGVSIENQAAEEAGRCKRLLGSLRYLYRNSSSKISMLVQTYLAVEVSTVLIAHCQCLGSLAGLESHDSRVADLKKLLQPSPAQRAARFQHVSTKDWGVVSFRWGAPGCWSCHLSTS